MRLSSISGGSKTVNLYWKPRAGIDFLGGTKRRAGPVLRDLGQNGFPGLSTVVCRLGWSDLS